MKKSYIISPLYLLSLLKSVSSQNQRDMFAGFWINFENSKNCTASFLVNKQGINGLLTSARCCVNNNCLNGNVFDSAYENEDDGNVTKIGQVHDAQFGGSNGLDYAFVTLDSVDWIPFNYTAGLIMNDTINENATITELYPVTADFAPTELGIPVCASGQSSGYLCGNLTELNLDLVVTNPWTGRPTILKGVNKVDLGEIGFENAEDLGGPVYVETDNNGTTTAQALGHIVATNNDNPNHKFLYYLPIDKVLNATNTELLTYKEEEKIDDTEIKYSEWNETQSVNEIDHHTYLKRFVSFRKVYAGDRIGVEIENSPYRRVCTTNFATGKKGSWTNDGILTSGRCDENLVVGLNVFLGGTNKKIGYIYKVEMGGGFRDEDYAFIKTDPGVNPIPCIAVPNESGTRDYLAVTSITTPSWIWETKLWLVGANSKKLYYGKVVGLDEAIYYIFEGRKQVITGLGKVELDGAVSSGEEFISSGEEFISSGDIGGPFFIKDSETTAKAIGHFLGTASFIDWLGKWKIHAFYMPTARTLKIQNLELKTTKFCPTMQGQQKAQIEVPPKK